jgi:glycosyltransferase involved in cell wall biosynthesis
MKRKAFALHKQNNFSIVHCRSYITSLIGLEMKKKYSPSHLTPNNPKPLFPSPFGEGIKGRGSKGAGLKFIFDMRGFWANERVEGGLWNLKNPLYKLIYNYFKKKEIEFLTHADYTISLTEKAKQIIHSWKNIPNQPIPIEVIPCCVDTEHFSRKKTNQKELTELRKSLGIKEDDFVLTYLGSIGTWYLLDEMLDFFSHLLKYKTNSKFLFITSEEKEFILRRAEQKNISLDKIIVQKVNYEKVPEYLSLGTISIFFYKLGFSICARSPVKFSEVMSMNMPIICNEGIGDINEIIQEYKLGIIIKNFSIEEYISTIKNLDILLNTAHEKIEKVTDKIFSLRQGINKYYLIYKNLLDQKECRK